MTTRADMVNAGKEAVRLGVQYIYGAKPDKGRFRTYSRAEIDQFRDWYGPDCVWWSDSDKAGQLCCDCSGLITFATGVVKGSWQLENEALEKVSIQTLKANWSKYVGWVLWMKGHVGIVSDTYGYYCAMDGSARNAVHLPLSYNNFTKVLRIPGVDYGSDTPTPAPQPQPAGNQPRYRVSTDPAGRSWLSEMQGPVDTGGSGDDFAGIVGRAIRWFACDAKRYRAFTRDSAWLPWVSQYNPGDLDYGCAGDGSEILAIEIEDPSVRFAVKIIGGGYYSDMLGQFDTGGSGDYYAGDMMNAIDAVRMRRA